MTDRERWLQQAELWSEAKVKNGCVSVSWWLGICGTVRNSGYERWYTVPRMLDDFEFYFKPKGRAMSELWWSTTKEGAQCRVWACLFMAEMCR